MCEGGTLAKKQLKLQKKINKTNYQILEFRNFIYIF